MTNAKNEGGLGFKEFEAVNDALLAKTAWRVLNCPDDLWVRTLKGIYFPNVPFLDAKTGGKASWFWNSILEGRKILMDDLFWRIRSGSDVRLWRDKWIKGVERNLSQFVDALKKQRIGRFLI